MQKEKIALICLVLFLLVIYAIKRFGGIGLVLSAGAALIGISVVSSCAGCLLLGAFLCILFFVLLVRKIGVNAVEEEISEITIAQRQEEEDEGFIDFSDD